MEKIQSFLKPMPVKTKVFTLFFVLVAGFSYLGCQTSSKTQKNTGPTTSVEIQKNENEISVMSYNVENLFDNKHDKDREDFTYLPLSEKNKPEVKAFCASQPKYRQGECYNMDWNNQALFTKMNNLAHVILEADQGKGPDNLMLVEVENISILQTFVNSYLKDSHYKTIVLLEGPDTRGIDPAFVSKFPMKGEPKLHIIPYQEKDPEQLKWAQRSRGILEVTVTLPNKKDLTFLVAHFPSQNNPTAWRAQAVQYAKNLITDYEKQGRAVIFGGDLNISAPEEASEKFFQTQLSAVGQVSHLVGCEKCQGSHFYKGEWSFLDAIVFSNNLKQVAGLELIPSSITDVRIPHAMKPNGTPLAFRVHNMQGVSDHFPLYARLKMIDANSK